MKMFEKKTKWIVLTAYNSGGNDFIVFTRKGLWTGMLYFKTKRITPFSTPSYNFRTDLFDIKKQFEKVLSLTNQNLN